jgi:acetoin utilization protein AcuB
MRIAEVMTSGVTTVPPQTSATDAWELMRLKGIHHLVVTEASEVVGVLSARDAGGRGGGSLRARSRVKDLMTTPVVTVKPTETIRRVANLMRGRTIGCVPVVEHRRLRGIVTVSDLLALLGGGVDRPSKPSRHDLQYRSPHRKHHRAYGAW